METSKMKNIVVLKNLPSNLVDEAILILKGNKNAKKLEYAYKSMQIDCNTASNNNEYVIKEAESVIANYISKLEKSKSIKKENVNSNKKYNLLKFYSIAISIIIAILFIKSMI